MSLWSLLLYKRLAFFDSSENKQGNCNLTCFLYQTNTNWLLQNIYDKTIKTTISFHICLFLLKTTHTYTYIHIQHTQTHVYKKKQTSNRTTFFKRAHTNNRKKLTEIKPHINRLNLKPKHIQHSTRSPTPNRKPSTNIAAGIQPTQSTRPTGIKWKIASKLNEITHMPSPSPLPTSLPSSSSSSSSLPLPLAIAFRNVPRPARATPCPAHCINYNQNFISNGIAIFARWRPAETAGAPSRRSIGPGEAAPMRGAYAATEASKLL